MLVAVISSEANLARARAVQGHRAPPGARARACPTRRRAPWPREGKAIVWIDNGLHASEVATRAARAAARAGASRRTRAPEMRAIRDNVILVLLPTHQPGRHGHGRRLVPPQSAHAVPGQPDAVAVPEVHRPRQQPRLLHADAGRDAASSAACCTSEWLPQVLYNQHQGTWPPRIFVPPFPDPFNPNIDPLIMRGVDLVGGAMQHRFEREGKDGVISRYEFSTWYNGSIRTTALLPQHHRHPHRDRPRLRHAVHVRTPRTSRAS